MTRLALAALMALALTGCTLALPAADLLLTAAMVAAEAQP